jgi:hypothetical protein
MDIKYNYNCVLYTVNRNDPIQIVCDVPCDQKVLKGIFEETMKNIICKMPAERTKLKSLFFEMNEHTIVFLCKECV